MTAAELSQHLRALLQVGRRPVGVAASVSQLFSHTSASRQPPWCQTTAPCQSSLPTLPTPCLCLPGRCLRAPVWPAGCCLASPAMHPRPQPPGVRHAGPRRGGVGGPRAQPAPVCPGLQAERHHSARLPLFALRRRRRAGRRPGGLLQAAPAAGAQQAGRFAAASPTEGRQSLGGAARPADAWLSCSLARSLTCLHACVSACRTTTGLVTQAAASC